MITDFSYKINNLWEDDHAFEGDSAASLTSLPPLPLLLSPRPPSPFRSPPQVSAHPPSGIPCRQRLGIGLVSVTTFSNSNKDFFLYTLASSFGVFSIWDGIGSLRPPGLSVSQASRRPSNARKKHPVITDLCATADRPADYLQRRGLLTTRGGITGNNTKGKHSRLAPVAELGGLFSLVMRSHTYKLSSHLEFR